MITVTLPVKLDIASCETLQATLLNSLTEADDVLLDAGQVEWLSTPALQLICAFESSLAAAGKTLSISAPSAVFTQAYNLFGLNKEGALHA